MTLSKRARMALDSESELDERERAVVAATINAMYASAVDEGVKLANDDRAAEVEAALIEFLPACRGG